MHLLPLNLAAIANICTKESGARFASNGVSLSVADDNTFIAMATDGRTAIRATGPCVGDASEYPQFPALASSPNGEMASIIPAADWKRAFADAVKITKRVKPVLQSVPVVIGKEVTSFGATDLERIAFSQPRNCEGRFPRLDQVIPENAVASVLVDPVYLANVLEIVGKLGTTDELRQVTIELHQPKGKRGGMECSAPIVVRGNASSALSVVGLVVPLVGEKKKGAKEPAIDDETEPAQGEIDRARMAELGARALAQETEIADLRKELERQTAIAENRLAELDSLRDDAQELLIGMTGERDKALAYGDAQTAKLTAIAELVKPLAFTGMASRVWEIANS